MFYHFSQNNSGGSFNFDPSAGITHHVIIEAVNADSANAKAEEIGIYFGGEHDCPCCGARWWSVDDLDADDVPSIYGSPISQMTADDVYKWMDDDPEVFVHYADGTVRGFF